MARILVIEDNPQNLYLVRFLLESAGHEVISARDGRSGITLAFEVAPALVLLDIQLPDIDGYAVAAALRMGSALDGVPIAAVTSFAMSGDRERILEAGCDAYLEKPIDPGTFLHEVEALLRDGSSWRR